MDTSNFTDKDFDNFFSSTKGTFFYKDLIYESLNTRKNSTTNSLHKFS